MHKKELNKRIVTAASKLADIIPNVNSFLERYAVDFDPAKETIKVSDIIKYPAIEFVSKQDNELWVLYIEAGINEYGFTVLPATEFNKLTGRGQFSR